MMSDSLHASVPVRAATRFASLDILRGAVMVLMAVDHVRVFSGVPAGGPTAGVFFTRWITHFCAPVFVFLAGTGAFLRGRRMSRAELSRYLVVRGALLVLLELTLNRFSWTFNFDYQHYLLAGVIWAIGWCMILLAILVQLPIQVVAILGVVVIAGHNAIDPVRRDVLESWNASPFAWAAPFVYFGFGSSVDFGPDGPSLVILYTIVPWIGVMAAGYAFGVVMTWDAATRTRACVAIGLGATALFVLLRGFNLYGDPRPWSASGTPMPAFFPFLNTTKYPASLSFLLMTLGPSIALIPWLETVRGRIADALAVFGRVPLFYYVLHIPLIHAAAIVVSIARTGAVDPWLFANHPMRAPNAPDGYAWSLALMYFVTALVVIALYPLCRWYDRRKRPPAPARTGVAL